LFLGLAAPLVAQKLLGTTGEYVIIFLILMAIMSTGSAEVIAVASIIIYDIYQVKANVYLFLDLENLGVGGGAGRG
jgi:Na+/proline symporter